LKLKSFPNKMQQLSRARLALGSLVWLLAVGPLGHSLELDPEAMERQVTLADSYLEAKFLGEQQTGGDRQNFQYTWSQVMVIQDWLERALSSPHERLDDPERAEFLASLLASTKSCQRQSVAFWASLVSARQSSGRGPALRDTSSPTFRLVSSLVLKCWQEFLDQLPRRLRTSLDKAPTGQFEASELLAHQLAKLRAPPTGGPKQTRVASRGDRKSVHIRERDASLEEPEVDAEAEAEADREDPLRKLRVWGGDSAELLAERLHWVAAEEQPEGEQEGGAKVARSSGRELALALKALAEMVRPEVGRLVEKEESRREALKEFLQSFLLEPCEALVGRVRATLATGGPLQSVAKRLELSLDPKAGNYLTRLANSQTSLDVVLQKYRICREFQANWEKVLDEVASLG